MARRGSDVEALASKELYYEGRTHVVKRAMSNVKVYRRRLHSSALYVIRPFMTPCNFLWIRLGVAADRFHCKANIDSGTTI